MKAFQLKKLVKNILNEIMTEGFQFHDFPELGTGDGMQVPTDVKYGNTYIGTIVSESDGYNISIIDSPSGDQKIKKNAQNIFKSKNLAAEALYRAWKLIRNRGIFNQ